MNDTIRLLQALDALMSLAISAGVNVERFRQMKEANAGDPLTESQLQELEAEARSTVGRL